jgi:hypothetical protein
MHRGDRAKDASLWARQPVAGKRMPGLRPTPQGAPPAVGLLLDEQAGRVLIMK